MFKRRILTSLVLPLLALAAAAQAPSTTQPVALPAGGVGLLVTQLDPSGQSTTSVLLVPSGGGLPSHAGAPSVSVSGLVPVVDGPQQFRTSWSDELGATHALVTEGLKHETADEHAARHAAALAPLLVQFPPVGPAADAAAPLQEGTQSFKTSWKGLDGLDHEVITVRKAGETVDKWAERHADGVAAMIKAFPPHISEVACAEAGAWRLAA